MSHALVDLLQCPPDEGPSGRLQVALDLHDAGMEMLAARMRREQPELSDAELDARVRAWLLDTPMASSGGRRFSWEEWVAGR